MPTGKSYRIKSGVLTLFRSNRICLLACGFVVASGGSAVFVDQPVQHGFSADSPDIEVDCRDAGNFALIAGTRWAMP